jgi:eukaryotic-like serine/threonine-protein kinase
MPYTVALSQAESLYPEYHFVAALTPSEQKAAFHVRDSNGTDLCLKLIAPGYSPERLNREIIALQSVAHPNVAALKEYTFSSKQGIQRHHIVEEFVEGVDLTDILTSKAPMPAAEVATLFSGIGRGIEVLHGAGIVHRDLKPSNVRIRANGEPVVIDLGLARHLDLPDLTKTSEGARIGTPLYFAPEQFAGTKHDIDHRTDLFAFGVLLFQASVGKHPFFPNQSNLPLSQAVCESVDHQSDLDFLALPQGWQLLIGRLLEKSRARRPQNAGQVVKMIEKLGATA